MRPTLLLLLLGILIAGCNGSSPTEPNASLGLNGTWEGELAAYPAGEDWSRVRLSAETIGTSVQGTLTSRNGVTHTVTGSVQGTAISLRINGLPQQTPCDVNLVLTRVAPVAIEGSLGGRCPNTLFGEFRLVRV
ncbi:MAG TPA: hypothetical protein VF787_16530 [Thermoanaerobaculia bacterium]